MVKKKSPVVLLTIIGVALAGAVVINAREHQPNLPQGADAPMPAAPAGQPAPKETKADVLGTSKDAGATGKTKQAPAASKAPPPPTKPQIPMPSPGDASGQWYSPEAHH